MSTTAEKLLELARQQIGVKENPRGSNNVKYNTWYYNGEVSGSAYPWCVVFVAWLFDRTEASALFFGGEKTASSSALYRYHEAQGQAVTDYRPGDIIYFFFDGSGHTGVCERFDGANIITIDGNTGTGSEANGGEVMRRTRSKQYIKGAWRPRYEEDDMVYYKTVAEIPYEEGRDVVQKLLNQKVILGSGGEDGLRLSDDMVRMLIYNERAGLYKEAEAKQ